MSTFFRLCIGALVVLSFAACSSTEKTGNGDAEENNNGPSISSEGLDKQAGPGLAPGTAKVNIQILDAGRDSKTWQSVVKEVLGYGSATPPLSVGTELAISVKSYFSNADARPGDKMDREQLVCIIQYVQGPGSTPGKGWSLVDIVEESKN